MWITDFIVKRHKLIIIFGAIIMLAFTVLSLYNETYLPSPVTDRDYFVQNDRNTLLYEAKLAAEGEI